MHLLIRCIFFAVTFMGLNAVRVLSLVSLILVFSSTIYVMVTNVKAVNYFEANKVNATDLVDCDYIESVMLGFFLLFAC